MTLRLRLVVALVALVTAGLASLGFATYSLYARYQFKHLDDQLRSSESLIDIQLDQLAGRTSDGGGGGGGGGGDPYSTQGGGQGNPAVSVLTGTYAELCDPSGAVLSHIQ